MAFATAQDLVTFSLKAAGILGVGQTPLAQDLSDGFDALNAMLGLWNRRRWLIWHLVDVSLVSTGAPYYSVGIGGDFDVPRPDRLEAAFFRQLIGPQLSPQPGFTIGVSTIGGPDGIGGSPYPFGFSGSSNVDYPLELLESREDYNDITLKGLQSWPQYIFYDSAYPLGFVYPWPIPQASIYELHLTIKDTLAGFASLSSAITFPPEYIEPVWTNLTLRLAAIYQTEVRPDIAAMARAGLETIRSENAQIRRLSMPSSVWSTQSKYNIYSDQEYS